MLLVCKAATDFVTIPKVSKCTQITFEMPEEVLLPTYTFREISYTDVLMFMYIVNVKTFSFLELGKGRENAENISLD